MKILKSGLILLMVLTMTGLLYAQSSSNITPGNTGKPLKETSSVAKDNLMGTKIERGVKNILFGWTDIPRSIIQVTRDTKNPVWGLFGGTLKGVGKAFPRTVSGIADVATFPIRDYDKSPVKPDAIDTRVQ